METVSLPSGAHEGNGCLRAMTSLPERLQAPSPEEGHGKGVSEGVSELSTQQTGITTASGRVYPIVKAIGEGIQGQLFTTHLPGGRSADKVMKLTNCQTEADIVKLPVWNHPHLVTCSHVEYVPSLRRWILLMDRYDTDLLEYLNQIRLSEAECQRLTRQLLEAVAHLHSNGVYHRDIKLENIMVWQEVEEEADVALTDDHDVDMGSAAASRKGSKMCINIALGDHGLAVRPGGDAVVGIGCGTLDYMAPEVINARRGVISSYHGAPADIWSIGCVVAAMLTCDQIRWRHDGHLVYPHNMRYCSKQALNFLGKMIEGDWRRRWTASQLLKHPWLRDAKSQL